MSFIQKLCCRHEKMVFEQAGDWGITYHTSNGLDNEHERYLKLRCDRCGKKVIRRQIKSGNRIMNFKEFETMNKEREAE